jgi:hypothetical protein
LAFVAVYQILAEKLDTPAHAGPGVIQQAKDRQSQSTFARPTLAHEAYNFTGKHVNTRASQHAFPLWVIDRKIG